MVTNFKLFFLQPDHKNFYGNKFSVFGKSILGFQKWTKINVQNRKAKILLQTRKFQFLYILINSFILTSSLLILFLLQGRAVCSSITKLLKTRIARAWKSPTFSRSSSRRATSSFSRSSSRRATSSLLKRLQPGGLPRDHFGLGFRV